MTSEQQEIVDFSFHHLQLELMRLDLMLHRQIQRFQLANEVLNEDVTYPSPLYMSAEQAFHLLQRPFGSTVAHLKGEDAKTYAQSLYEVEKRIGQFIDSVEDPGQLRLLAMGGLLGLDRFDLDAFIIALAPHLDSRFGKLYAYLQDDLTKKRPSVNLILDLLGDETPLRLLQLRHFQYDAPLLKQHLVKFTPDDENDHMPIIEKSILLDESIVSWLLFGVYRPPIALKEVLKFVSDPQPDLHLLSNKQMVQLDRMRRKEDLLALVGPDELCREAASKYVAATAGRPLLILNLREVQEKSTPLLPVTQRLMRDALLIGAVPQLDAWDACLKDGAPPSQLLEVLCEFPGKIVVSSQKEWQIRQVPRDRRVQHFKLPLPSAQQRLKLLTHYVGEDNDADDIALTELAGQFSMSSTQIQDMVDAARDIAGQNGRDLQNADLFMAARSHSNPRLLDLARKLTPRYGWTDIILPEDEIMLLHEMVDTVKSRPLVLHEWGVGKKLAPSEGITALFYGPPGTGKTMAAEVLASELKLDLYKIDLSSMVSKYIGETEKNLEKIFTEAETSNAILFFDEADAIFGKRSEVKDAHDRFANIEVSYLLQRMEIFNGVTILATNLKANLDEAFMRRLQFAVSFPFPRKSDRLRIWKSLFPSTIPRVPDLDFERMADQFNISGSNIRNIIITASYLAAANGQVVTMEHLLHGAKRELQKMGRLVNDQEFRLERNKH